MPVRGRAGDRPRRIPAVPGAEQRRDHARRGDRALAPRRAQYHHAGQRDPDPFRGRHRRVGGRHPAGPGAVAGDRAVAGRVPGHGEPRAARAADLDQGLGRDPAGCHGDAGAGGDARVLPHHRRADRPHARPHQRPSRRGAHRHGHALGVARAHGGRRPGGPGEEHVPERGKRTQRPHRPRTGASPGDGRPAAYRPGAEQPLRQCRQALSQVGPHPGRRRPRRGARRGLGQRRRPGHRAGAVAASVPQVQPGRHQGRRARARGAGWGSPSARVWWRRTGDASGPRAVAADRGHGSPSRSRWWRRRDAVRRPSSATAGRVGSGEGTRRHASSWSTTIRRRCDTCATHSPMRITSRS